MKAIITEMDEPMLIGNITIDVDLSAYHGKVKASKSHSIQPIADRRRPSHIVGAIGHLLMIDLLIRHGWETLPYSLGRGTHPLHLGDPVKFLENTTGKLLSEEARKFLNSRRIGFLGMGLESDILVAKKDMFAMGEIKSSQKNIGVFKLTLPEYIYYNRAYEAGVLIKLILVKLLDDVHVSISKYIGELTNTGLFRVTLYTGGSKPYILKLVLKNPGVNLTEIASMIPGMPNWAVESHLMELDLARLVYKEKDKWYCTHKGSTLIKSKEQP